MNHETQRLLVAASRGARVQIRSSGADIWSDTGTFYTLLPEIYRIHPDDIEMQYGPISTELRENKRPRYGSLFYAAKEMIASHAVLSYTETVAWMQRNDTETCQWADLFLAELLADEGV